MCIYCDYCVYHYKSTELVSLYTLDIGLKINIIIIIIISQIQTCFRVVVGPGLVSTSPDIIRSRASHPAGPYGRLVKKTRDDLAANYMLPNNQK